MARPRFRTDAQGQVATPRVDTLSDADLEHLNRLLPWQSFTLDAKGRPLGRPASATKRNKPQSIPDRRIVELDRRVPLDGLHVLEIGCFEGLHTIALLDRGARVTAVDTRIEHVMKTVARLWAFGLQTEVLLCDVELPAARQQLPEVDVTHHVGVLYHLVDPVRHLRDILSRTRKAVMLDTHYAAQGMAAETYEVEGRSFAFQRIVEGGREDAFAGMYDHAKWLPLETLTQLLSEAGFTAVDVAQLREERNGPRALIYAARTS